MEMREVKIKMVCEVDEKGQSIKYFGNFIL